MRDSEGLCWAAAKQNDLPDNYTQFLNANGLRGMRVGILRQLSNTPTADPEFQTLFARAIADMAQAGKPPACFAMMHEARAAIY